MSENETPVGQELARYSAELNEGSPALLARVWSDLNTASAEVRAAEVRKRLDDPATSRVHRNPQHTPVGSELEQQVARNAGRLRGESESSVVAALAAKTTFVSSPAEVARLVERHIAAGTASHVSPAYDRVSAIAAREFPQMSEAGIDRLARERGVELNRQRDDREIVTAIARILRAPALASRFSSPVLPEGDFRLALGGSGTRVQVVKPAEPNRHAQTGQFQAAAPARKRPSF